VISGQLDGSRLSACVLINLMRAGRPRSITDH